MSGSEDLKTLGHGDMLRKIDKLRELNINTIVPLPQLVVVGDQSSGKSSVLESLTGFSFPRGPSLCTRYATQIACSHGMEEEKSVTISIIPRPDAGEELKSRLAKVHRRFSGTFDSEKLLEVLSEANIAMGISVTATDGGEERRGAAFSRDILKIEVTGKDQPHLTLIDVPGLFRVDKPGVTTEEDIVLVEDMVKSYMADKRTMILAVVPCHSDADTQEIIRQAKVADPEGTRTMVVLTKPDLIQEKAFLDVTMNLIRDKGKLTLGYHVVKNRGADDDESTWKELGAKESAFFSKKPWSEESRHCGVDSLKLKLRDFLYEIMKKGLPKVKTEITQQLCERNEKLEALGPARSDPPAQRLYLAKLASDFQAITQAALNGYYSGKPLFRTDPDLKLITRIFKLQKTFAETFRNRAHLHEFDLSDEEEEEEEDAVSRDEPSNESLTSRSPGLVTPEHDELGTIVVQEDYECSPVDQVSLVDRIKDIFEESRGPDLGTFGGTVLPAVFAEQSKKWEPLTLCHISKVIRLVHEFIKNLLKHLCADEKIRDELWNSQLLDKLRECYAKAMENARFLLHIECGTRPSTFNHYFNDNLQKNRAHRQQSLMENRAVTIDDVSGNPRKGRYVAVEEIQKAAANKDNDGQLCDDMLDVFESYYKVAQKRFVDVLYQQTISHFLLEGEASPLKILKPELIMLLPDEELGMIAGEDAVSQNRREVWLREKSNLEAALKIV